MIVNLNFHRESWECTHLGVPVRALPEMTDRQLKEQRSPLRGTPSNKLAAQMTWENRKGKQALAYLSSPVGVVFCWFRQTSDSRIFILWTQTCSSRLQGPLGPPSQTGATLLASQFVSSKLLVLSSLADSAVPQPTEDLYGAITLLLQPYTFLFLNGPNTRMDYHSSQTYHCQSHNESQSPEENHFHKNRQLTSKMGLLSERVVLCNYQLLLS